MLAEPALHIGDTFEVSQENRGAKALEPVVGAVPFHPGLGGCRGLWQKWDKGILLAVQKWRAVYND